MDNSLLQTFFTISPENVSSVLDLNFLGTLNPHPGICTADAGPPGLQYHQSVQHERLYPADQDPGLLRRKGGGIQLYTVAGGAFQQGGHPGQRHCPGFFASEQNERLLFNEDGTPTARAQKVLAGTPAGRMGRPDELEGALLFLVNNEAAGFINGIVLPVDGGFQAYSGV